MAPWLVVDHNFFAGWANLMISAFCQGSLALVFFWVLIRLFPGINPAIQCWAWRLTCLKILVALIWVKPLKVYFHLQIGLRQLGWLLVNSLPPIHLAKTTQPFLKTDQPFLNPCGEAMFWFLLWLTGLIVFWAGLFYLGCRRKNNGNNCIPIIDPAIIGLYQDIGLRNKFRKRPQLFAADGISSPRLQGIIHPKIILPSSQLSGFTTDELRLILAHELAHYQRGDLIWNGLMTLTCTVFFFVPYIWWARKKLAELQEICCDRLAVHYSNTTAAMFGRILLQLSLLQEKPGKIGPSVSTSVGFASQSIKLLKSRLKALQSVNRINRKRMGVTGVILIILGTAMVIPWRLGHSQTLPANLVISYLSRDRFELSARVMLPKNEIKTITALIDGKQLSPTYNANGMYLGFTRFNGDKFPLAGPHQVTVKAWTPTGVKLVQHWIYFHDSMIWSSQNLGLESNKTVVKIGPFFWVVNNRKFPL